MSTTKQITTTLNEYPIPQSDGLELQIIADLISQPEVIAEAEKTLTHEMFERSDCRSAWMALKRMAKEGMTIDLASAYSRIDKDFLIKGVIPLMSHSGGMMASSQHFAALRDMHIKRKCYFAAMEFLSDATNPSVRAEDIIGNAGRLADKLKKEVNSDKDTQHISAVINTLADEIGVKKRDKELGISLRVPTGFTSLDYLTFGGFNGGNLVILAARPSVGKTAIMLQMAMAAAKAGKKVNLFNLEMTNTDLAQRMLFATERVTPLQMARGEVEWDDFEVAAGQYSSKPMYLNDSARTIDEIRSKIILNCQARKCDIAFIDYLGLIRSNSKANLSQAITEMTNELKSVALECRIPIVLLCQLNRASASEKRPPEMHDLRDSGSIEQDADIILMLERCGENEINIWVRKNRQGKAGDLKITVAANKTYTVFTEINNDNPYDPMPTAAPNPIKALEEECHRLTRTPFTEFENDNSEFPF